MSDSSLLHLTKQRLEELSHRPVRGLGQNFLVSEKVVAKIIQAVVKEQPRHMVEIGPGLGALTDRLLELGLPLTAIELDKDLVEYWRRRGLAVVDHDALKVDWARLPLPDGTVLVSNLPYQISTHLVIDRCPGPAAIKSMVLMFQKEVAERLLARPRTKGYGLLSVMAQTYFAVERLLEAGPRDFWPAPEIASQVLVFRRLPTPPVGLGPGFLRFLKGAFAQRRKFLIKNILAQPPRAGLKQDDVAGCLADLAINAKARAEELSVEQFQQLFLRLVGVNVRGH